MTGPDQQVRTEKTAPDLKNSALPKEIRHNPEGPE